MASELGRTIKERRTSLKIGLRGLARRIDKSPSFITILENSDNPPTGSEKTLRAIEQELKFDRDTLITLAGKTPGDVTPSDPQEAALYRRVKGMSDADKRKLEEYMDALRDDATEES